MYNSIPTKGYGVDADGVYVGPEGPRIMLDCRECSQHLKSLGELKTVRWAHLENCTNLTTLGSLTVVVSDLFLDGCTNLRSLGNLKKVGGMVVFKSYDPESDIWIWEDLQPLKKRIKDYSAMLAHEALNALQEEEVQQVPLYKNILLDVLAGETGH